MASGSWSSWLLGRGSGSGAQRDKARETIVELRQHLIMLEKKEDHLKYVGLFMASFAGVAALRGARYRGGVGPPHRRHTTQAEAAARYDTGPPSPDCPGTPQS